MQIHCNHNTHISTDNVTQHDIQYSTVHVIITVSVRLGLINHVQ